MVKILFLDIDGVVNNQENFNPSQKRTPYPIDSYCAFLVGKIQIATDCKVVLSSSWRHYPDAVKIVSDSVVEIIDITPDFLIVKDDNGKDVTRGAEINKWLDSQSLKSDFFVDKYVILDDDSDFYDDQPLFKTTFKTGLTDEISQNVIDYLNGEDNE